MADAKEAKGSAESGLLGPFLGHVTESSIKIWLHAERSRPEVYVTLHKGKVDGDRVATAELHLAPENLHTDCRTVSGLEPDTLYYYRLWTNPAYSVRLDLAGLTRPRSN